MPFDFFNRGIIATVAIPTIPTAQVISAMTTIQSSHNPKAESFVKKP
jgi:hypothetical protein